MEEIQNLHSFHRKLRELPKYTEITLRQLFWLKVLPLNGFQAEMANEFADVTPSMISRDLKALHEALNVKPFVSAEGGEFKLTDEAQQVNELCEPLMNLLGRFCDNDAGRVVKIGAGGSILGWLVGGKISDIRDLCSKKEGDIGRLSEVRVSCSPIANRKVLQGVRSGFLDFGIVRSSLLIHENNKSNSLIKSRKIGEVKYALVLPDEVVDRYRHLLINDDFDYEAQVEIFKNEFFATVAAEGEFRVQLEAAFDDAEITPKIEFSYRSFPQILPHLLAGTHAGIAPMLPNWNVNIPNCNFYELRLISHYKREISLIYSRKLVPKWVDIDELVDMLSWTNQIVSPNK